MLITSCVDVQDQYKPSGQFKNAKTAFCIHNIAFQVKACCCAAGVTSQLSNFRAVHAHPT